MNKYYALAIVPLILLHALNSTAAQKNEHGSVSKNEHGSVSKNEHGSMIAKAPSLQKEGIKKITKTKEHAENTDATFGGKAGEASITEAPSGPAITKPKVASEAAPGTQQQAVSEPAKPVEAPPTTPVEKVVAAPANEAKKETQKNPNMKVVSAEQALRWLTNGNTRYLKKTQRKDGRSQQDRERVALGQNPHAIVVASADSSVPPEIVFDQALGEIYVIRVAGPSLDSAVVASVEWALENLQPKLLVVMGNTKSAAIDAALKIKEGESAGSEALDKVLADIRPRLKSIPADRISPNHEVESTVNADGVARDLVARSAIVRKHVEGGELVIKPALYRLETGKVSFY
jgi:carbonic anhydrase